MDAVTLSPLTAALLALAGLAGGIIDAIAGQSGLITDSSLPPEVPVHGKFE